MQKQRTRYDHLFGPGPKRILSLDGGGERGLRAGEVMVTDDHLPRRFDPS
jgi:hypothetical protein